MAGVHDLVTTVLCHALGAGGRGTEAVLCHALGAGGRGTEGLEAKIFSQSCALLLGQGAGVLRRTQPHFLSASVLGEATADNTEWNGFFRPGSS